MGQIIGYIISSIIVSIISFVGLGGIVLGVLVDMKGLGEQLIALAIIITTIMELLSFIGTIFLGSDFSIKNILENIKAKLKKSEKKSKNNSNNENSKMKVRYIIELVLLLGIAIYSVINPTHSTVTKVIYNGFFIKLFSNLLIPLIIINIINSIIDEFMGFFSSILSSIGLLIASFVIGLSVSSAMLFVASVWYPDIETTIKGSWFIYDNPNFNEIRGKDFDATEYLKSEFQKLNENSRQTANCDYNEETCMQNIKRQIYSAVSVKNTSIRTYGYKYISRVEIDTNTDILCISDLKTTYRSFFKINYKDYSFEETTIDEYLKYEK